MATSPIVKKHAFNFFGGEILNKMGAAWFVSYAYYDRVDSAHKNWQLVGHKGRISVYKKSVSYHRYWLDRLMKMHKIDKNEIGLTAKQIKDMAEEVMDSAW